MSEVKRAVEGISVEYRNSELEFGFVSLANKMPIIGDPDEDKDFTIPAVIKLKPCSICPADKSSKATFSLSDLTLFYIEIFHKATDPDVYVKIISDAEESYFYFDCKPDDADHFESYVHFTSFNFVELGISFLKHRTGEEDKAILIKRGTGSIPCEENCSLHEGQLCSSMKLCSVQQLKQFICKQNTKRGDPWHVHARVVLTLSQKKESIDAMTRKYRDVNLGKILFEKIDSISDFKFVFEKEERTFSCNKIVLSAYSDVFQAMFSSSMIESETNEMLVKDMSPECVESMIKFMYTGELEGVIADNVLIFELLQAGNKYGIKRLQAASKEILLLKMEEDFDFDCKDLLAMFVFCNQVGGLEPLLSKIARTMKRKSDVLFDSVEFDELLQNDRTLAKQIMKLVAE